MDALVDDRIEQVEAVFKARGWTLGLAESCTGGLMASWICARPGVSSWFAGAVVSYARAVKADVLNVPKPLMLAHGEVSVPVARAMAAGGLMALSCDWCVSITGIAGPSGGTPEKPVGTVCFAVLGPGFESTTTQVFLASGGRKDIQRQAALFAFDLLLSAMR